MNEQLEQTLTALLAEIGSEPDAWHEALPRVYDQLRQLARSVSAPGSEDATLSPTALVHEAWAKLSSGSSEGFRDREHFLAVAAITMRHVLVDAARRRGAQRRGGDRARVTLSDLAEGGADCDLLDLDAALDELGVLSSRQARVVELRYFSGLSVPEVASCLDVSVSTIEADWRLARAWLGRRLKSS